jgi:hypothetical protein
MPARTPGAALPVLACGPVRAVCALVRRTLRASCARLRSPLGRSAARLRAAPLSAHSYGATLRLLRL